MGWGKDSQEYGGAEFNFSYSATQVLGRKDSWDQMGVAFPYPASSHQVYSGHWLNLPVLPTGWLPISLSSHRFLQLDEFASVAPKTHGNTSFIVKKNGKTGSVVHA